MSLACGQNAEGASGFAGQPDPAQGAAGNIPGGRPGTLAFEAVVFDMDGVLTQTATVHAEAWKQLFDEYLAARSARYGEPFREFTHEGDYRTYVDGRPRYRGVEAFLRSRGITLPYGAATDEPGAQTICGLGNRKNQLFNRILRERGVRVYDSTVALIIALRRRGVRVGLATSSRNAVDILELTGTRFLFGAVVDGLVSEQLGLRGKPEPDIFHEACAGLRVHPSRAVVVEDAASGVEAGSRGGFALTLGVAREGNAAELLARGADVAVDDLARLDVDGINNLVLKRKAGFEAG